MIKKLTFLLFGLAFCGILSASDAGAPSDLIVTVSKSVVLDHNTQIKRISISNGDIAEAVAVSSKEVLLNGKSQGDTTLMLWDAAGTRSAYEVHVLPNEAQIEAVKAELSKEVGTAASLTVEGKNVFLRGTVSDEIIADRALSIASTLGKVVNLLRVSVGPGDPQILLKVRFANISRSATQQLGFNLFTGDQKGVSNVTTGQFGNNPTGVTSSQGSQVNFTDLLNIFYFRPDLNIAAVIKALEAKSILEILAEPNLLTVSGRPASFLAGGEYPFPTIQGGAAGVGQVTVQFKEFGIRLGFLPSITPRGTIRMTVTPEVSSLDYANALVVNGSTIPGLATRRVQTEVELENGQSFVIAGLLNNQTQEQLNKIPGLANIPLLGKLFESRSLSKSNTELLVMVTPELVRPIPAGVAGPEIQKPLPFLKDSSPAAPRTPGAAVTGPVSPLVKVDSLPIEVIKNAEQPANIGTGAPQNANPPLQAPPISSPLLQGNAPPSNPPGNPNH
ncbi:MAG: pilus assembly protein N-terminal domain-containing protein [Acidobacteriaceae bacterium]|nr:pilus assembly protein N-terminal domain-containing protein [Acidobacteriaceae bacterium]